MVFESEALYTLTVLKLLIVDDEYEIRTTLANAFPWDRCGFVVAGQAESLAEAKALAGKADFDAVLCDIRMGDGTGLDFARWSREQGKRHRIVFLSAYRKFEYAQEAMVYGVRSYLVKPPDVDRTVALFEEIRSEIEAELSAGAETGSIVDLVRTYVEGNYQDAKIEKAAQLARMNSHYLSTYFKEKSGETFSDFLLRTRMGQAGKLLLEGRFRTNEISDRIGYSDPKNFVRAFRRYYGVSPRDYKRAGGVPAAIIPPAAIVPPAASRGSPPASGQESDTRVPFPGSDHSSH